MVKLAELKHLQGTRGVGQEDKNLDAHWNTSLKRQLKSVANYQSVVKDLKVVLSEIFRS